LDKQNSGSSILKKKLLYKKNYYIKKTIISMNMLISVPKIQYL